MTGPCGITLWKIIKAALGRKRHYFVLAPFITYVEAIKKVDIDSILANRPAEFYSIVLEYFRGDSEAAYFFIDYMLSAIIPGDYETREKLISYMRSGDNERAKALVDEILERAREKLSI